MFKFHISCKSMKDRNTLYLHSAGRCGGMSCCGLCHNLAGWEVTLLKWLSTYPHHLQLLFALFLPFSLKAVKKSLNISDLLQTWVSILNVIQYTHKTSFFSLHASSVSTIQYWQQDMRHTCHIKVFRSTFKNKCCYQRCAMYHTLPLPDYLVCAKELADITHSHESFQYSFCL